MRRMRDSDSDHIFNEVAVEEAVPVSPGAAVWRRARALCATRSQPSGKSTLGGTPQSMTIAGRRYNLAHRQS
jgi:hypothetical protein